VGLRGGRGPPAWFVARMDKLWAPIHCALSDGTIDGTPRRAAALQRRAGGPPGVRVAVGRLRVPQNTRRRSPEIAGGLGGAEPRRVRRESGRWSHPNPDSDALGLSFTAGGGGVLLAVCRGDAGRSTSGPQRRGLAVLFCWG